MTHDDTPMWEDPQESSALRQLLRAGRVENAEYDVESGLARHLAQLQAGAQMPAWAAQTTLQKSASWSVLAWLVPPVISAGVVGAWLALQPTPASLVPSVPKAPAVIDPAVISPAVTNKDTSPAAERELERSQPEAPPVPAGAQDRSADDMRANAERENAALAREAGEPHDHAAVVAHPPRVATRSASLRRSRLARNEEAPNAVGAGAARSGRDARDVESDARSVEQAPQPERVQHAAAPAAAMPATDAKSQPAERRGTQDEAIAQTNADKSDKTDKVGHQDDEVSGARLEREMRMLAVAQRVLTEDPERSLRLCRQGEREFRGSMFSAERKQVALLALVQLGKLDQARREGIPFLRAFPNAPWSARLRLALSTGELPSP